MRDSIYHDEAVMMTRSSANRPTKPVRRPRTIAEPELGELLAHLGRQLAREYVRLLEDTRPADPSRREEAR